MWDKGIVFIQQPFNKGNILIDTGGLKNTDVATKRIIPYLESQVFFLWMLFLFHIKILIIVGR